MCEERDLYLIEDAAESFGASLDGEKVGTFGVAGMFSFCQTKVFTTGEGGCIVTNSKEIADKLRLIRDHSREKPYVTLGYGWRMPDCIAGLGISQIEKVDWLIKTRREKADYYIQKLKEVDGISIPEFPSNMFHVYQEFHIRTPRRDELKQFLTERGIGNRISFPLIHKAEIYSEDISLPVNEKIVSETLTLPLYPSLTQEEQDYVISSIKEFYEK